MNRERWLFAAVLGLLALYWFVMRDPAQPSTAVRPGERSVDLLDVRPADLGDRMLGTPDPGAFTLVTNERPHPRVELDLPPRVDLDPIWPPTSRSLRTSLLGRYRHPYAPPSSDAASLELPDLGGDEAAEAPAGAAVAGRVDVWQTFQRSLRVRGRVLEIVAGGATLKPGRDLPPVEQVARTSDAQSFHRALAWLEIDPERAKTQLNVRSVRVQMESGGATTHSFDDQIHDFEIAVEGEERGFYEGLQEYLKLTRSGAGFKDYERAGQKLLAAGIDRDDDRHLLEWASFLLREARSKLGSADVNLVADITLALLEAEHRLNRQERMLALAFEYLASASARDDVIQRFGAILESRSYMLPALAEQVYERAPRSADAQRSRAALLVRLGRFEEAERLLASGQAGRGSETDLLQARLALAQGRLDQARSLVRGLAGGEHAAEANQILGAAAYAEGDAAAAEAAFLAAVRADPRRSTAYSDLGLALAVQGKTADAVAAFDRAYRLDPLDNAVTPRLGKVVLELAAGRIDEASAQLAALQTDNPRHLLVRYYVGYVQERQGRLADAARTYRSVLDDDHRYRIAIARLGVVESLRAEEGGAEETVAAAVAHLGKAVDIHPDDPELHYVLGRFLVARKLQPSEADRLLERAQKLPAPSDEPDLPLWAEAARAILVYRDESRPELDALSAFNRVMDSVRLREGGDVQRAEKHPAYAYAAAMRDRVRETMNRVVVVWTFTQKPREGSGWTVSEFQGMNVSFSKEGGGRASFHGRMNRGGEERSIENETKFLSLAYGPPGLKAADLHEAVLAGVCPPDTEVDFGVGILSGQARRRMGVQLKLDARADLVGVRLDGGSAEIFKQDRGRTYIPFPAVPWPADGRFEIRFVVEDHATGRFRIELNGVNVFGTQLDGGTETCSLFGRGSGGRDVEIVVWVDGNDGDRIEGIRLERLKLVKSK